MLIGLAGLECVRDAPSPARILWRPPFSDWRLAEVPCWRGKLFLWHYALGSQVIVLDRSIGKSDPADTCHAEIRRLSATIPLRLVGVCGALFTWVTCLGLPMLAMRFDFAGFVFGVCIAANSWLGSVIMLSLYEARLAPRTPHPAANLRITLGSPFGVWARAGAVTERITSRHDSANMMVALLSRERMRALIRPAWYDRNAGPMEANTFEQQLLAAMDSSFVESLFLVPPRNRDRAAKYCPRCEATFQPFASQCSDCPGAVLLERVGTNDSA